MNRKSLFAIAAIAAVASLNSFAGEVDPATQFAEPLVSVKSRAEVLGELSAYKQRGVNPWSNGYNLFAQSRSTQDRAQVRAEYIQNRERVAAIGSEDSGSAYLSQQESSRAAPETLAGSPRTAQY